MVILIGGASHTGKTLMAQRLLEKYKYPYLSIDHLKMGLYRANIGCGFTPLDSAEFIGEKLWPVLKGIIMTNIENNQNIIIEGCYILPQKVLELEDGYLNRVIPLFLGFSQDYVEKFFQTKILRHRNIIESRAHDDDMAINEYVKDNKKQKEHCLLANMQYFEITADYEAEMRDVYIWIDKELSKRRC
ncbi:MAG: 2-phosphoglycerate kinase [Clostridiales bacterium]|jgi:putative acetyltransferase|nr:2-phosphoglycerate kinase [Clostridiales bacterium]